MKKLLTPVLWFCISLLLLLPSVYVIIIYSFHKDLALDKRKFVEEVSKVLASFVLALVSLGLSQLGEQMKTKRKADALAANIRASLIRGQQHITALTTISPPVLQRNEIEDLRINKEFYETLRDRIDSLSQIINEAQQQLFRSEPEAISHCSDLANALALVWDSVTSYSKKPSRDYLVRFQQSLRALQGVTGQI
jgi:hypothetical protein